MADVTDTKFLSITDSAADLWGHMDIRVLAVKVDGVWQNLITICYLRAEKPRSMKLPVTEHIGAWQSTRPIAKLPALLKQLQKGYLRVGGTSIRYLNWRTGDAGEKGLPYGAARASFHDVTLWREQGLTKWSHWDLGAGGSPMHDVIVKAGIDGALLDNELRTLPEPYDGIDSVARFCVGYPHQVMRGAHNVAYHILAPLEVLMVLDECSFRSGELHYAITAGSKAATGRAKLGVFAWKGEEIKHQVSVDLSNEGWVEFDGEFSCEGDVRLEGASSATMLLSVLGYTVHRHTLVDYAAGGTNPRVSAYEPFDPDLTALKKSFAHTGEKSDRFEAAVARLFRFLGFDVEHLTSPISDAVDVIAISETSMVLLAVECTTGDINNKGKLGGLITRTKEIEATERFKGHHEVFSVLATSLEAKDISRAGMRAAWEDKVAVLAREDLLELLEMACTGRPVVSAVERIRLKANTRPFGEE